MPSLQIKRGTRTQIDTAASGSGLKEGELYLVTDEGKLLVGTGPTAYSEVTVNADWNAVSGSSQILNRPTVYTTTNSATPPAGAIEGDTWWDSETGTTFVYYDDGDTGQWVQSGIINDLVKIPEGASIILYLSGLDADISPTTKAAIIPYFPYGVKVEELILQVDEAPTGNNIEVDININGTSFFKFEEEIHYVINIDATEKSSKDATTPYVIDTANFPNALIEEGVELTVDIDLVGATVPGQNLVLVIKGVVQE